MPSEPSANRTLRFDDPRLGMSIVGRSLVRVCEYLSYLVFGACIVTLLIADISWMKWLGAFLGIIFLDHLMHVRNGELELSELEGGVSINAARYMTPAAYALVERAYDRTVMAKTNFYLEAVRQLLNAPEIKEGLRRLDVQLEEFKQKIEALTEESGRAVPEGAGRDYRTDATALIEKAFDCALHNKHRFIQTSDIFSGLARVEEPALSRFFVTFDMNHDDLEQALLFSELGRTYRWFQKPPAALGGFTFESQRKMRHRVMNRAWTARPTPTLDAHSTDLTDLARQNDIGFMIGHEAEYARLKDTLARVSAPNALLVGEQGAGKETIVMHLAFDLTKDAVPQVLFDKRLVSLELSSLVAGAPQEELQKRIHTIVEEITMAGNIILYIPDIHNLVKTSGTEYLSAADALLPIIKNDAFPIIGATYPKEYKQHIEPRSDFSTAFEVIRVNAITDAEAVRLLVYESLFFERKTKIVVSFGAVKAAVKLANKYLHRKPLPGAAEELLKDGIAAVERRGGRYLDADGIIAATEERTHIPIHQVGAAEADTLLRLEETVHKSYINQEEAVRAIADALREYRSGLTRTKGPIANFLFVGPTGVGKTELSKILAKLEFGSEKAMIRFDMTEYQDKQSFQRFIGSPDGQVAGALTSIVDENPYSLVLLDEFEKAYPDILNLFLQVFDDGRLTDALERTIDFSNTIIIATSNAHSDIVNEALSKGENMADIAEYLKKRLTDVFKPELINRFTKVVVFKNLGVDDIRKVAELNLKEFAATLSDQGIALVFGRDVVDEVVKRGYDPAFGARPLRRAIDAMLRAPLAGLLLKKEFERGSKVRVTMDGTECRFEKDVSEAPKSA